MFESTGIFDVKLISKIKYKLITKTNLMVIKIVYILLLLMMLGFGVIGNDEAAVIKGLQSIAIVIFLHFIAGEILSKKIMRTIKQVEVEKCKYNTWIDEDGIVMESVVTGKKATASFDVIEQITWFDDVILFLTDKLSICLLFTDKLSADEEIELRNYLVQKLPHVKISKYKNEKRIALIYVILAIVVFGVFMIKTHF